MNYFMSDIHGASEAYFSLKDKINFKNNDDLFILGDILDGNKKNPEAGIEILQDIMENDNIHLVLGDHEYAHIMNFISKESDEDMNEWEDYVINSSLKGGPFLEYFYSHLSQKEREKYMSFLVSCEMTGLIKIGKRYFYLVHGSPAVFRNNEICDWQKNVCTTPIVLDYNYSFAIKNDPNIQIPKEMNRLNTFIISGHIPAKYYLENNDILFHKIYGNNRQLSNETPLTQRIILSNNKMLLDCGCKEDSLGKIKNGWISTLACVAIDAAGFYTEYY